MKKVLSIILFIYQGCTVPNNCVETNTIYLKYRQFIETRIQLAHNGGYDVGHLENEKKLKQELFSKICKKISKSTRVIIIEQVPLFDPNRFGIVFLPDENQFIYFSQNRKGSLQLRNEKSNNYQSIKKILDIVKVDFQKNASRLTVYFDKIIVTDASSLTLFLLDTKDNSQKEIFYAFAYMPDVIMSNEFDQEFMKE